MKRAALSALCAVALAAAGSARAEDPSAIAKALSSQFIELCEAGKVGEAAALYLDDAVIVFPAEGARAEGKTAIAKALGELCGPEMGKSTWVAGRGSWLDANETAIVATGAWATSGTGPDGKTVTVTVRTTELLVKTPGGWKYRIDHASVGVPPPAEAPPPAP